MQKDAKSYGLDVKGLTNERNEADRVQGELERLMDEEKMANAREAASAKAKMFIADPAATQVIATSFKGDVKAFLDSAISNPKFASKAVGWKDQYDLAYSNALKEAQPTLATVLKYQAALKKSANSERSLLQAHENWNSMKGVPGAYSSSRSEEGPGGDARKFPPPLGAGGSAEFKLPPPSDTWPGSAAEFRSVPVASAAAPPVVSMAPPAGTPTPTIAAPKQGPSAWPALGRAAATLANSFTGQVVDQARNTILPAALRWNPAYQGRYAQAGFAPYRWAGNQLLGLRQQALNRFNTLYPTQGQAPLVQPTAPVPTEMISPAEFLSY
jgi:hypothetical protein